MPDKQFRIEDILTEVQIRVPQVHRKTNLRDAVGALGGMANVEVAAAHAAMEVNHKPDAGELAEIKEAIEGRGGRVFG